MPVKSRSKTFKPGDTPDEALKFFNTEIKDALEWTKPHDVTDDECVFKKRLIITITYDRDDKTE